MNLLQEFICEVISFDRLLRDAGSNHGVIVSNSDDSTHLTLFTLSDIVPRAYVSAHQRKNIWVIDYLYGTSARDSLLILSLAMEKFEVVTPSRDLSPKAKQLLKTLHAKLLNTGRVTGANPETALYYNPSSTGKLKKLQLIGKKAIESAGLTEDDVTELAVAEFERIYQSSNTEIDSFANASEETLNRLVDEKRFRDLTTAFYDLNLAIIDDPRSNWIRQWFFNIEDKFRPVLEIEAKSSSQSASVARTILAYYELLRGEQ